MIFLKILIKWYNKCLSFSLLLDISSEWRIQSRIWNVYAPLRMFEALHNFLIFFTSTYSCIFINVCNIPQLECDHKDINNYNSIFVGVWNIRMATASTLLPDTQGVQFTARPAVLRTKENIKSRNGRSSSLSKPATDSQILLNFTEHFQRSNCIFTFWSSFINFQ